MNEQSWHAHYEPGVPWQMSFAELTLGDMLTRAAERFGDQPAILFQNCRMSYRELEHEVDCLATALARLGVERGDRVAIHLPNVPQAVISYYAVLRLGAVVVMTNPMYVEREIEEQWNDAGCEIAITADFLYERHLEDLRERLPVRHYIVASIPEYLRFPLNWIAPFALRRQDPPVIARVEMGETVSAFRELVSATEPDLPQVAVGFDDLAVLQYTGGTTGRSKGAMLTHRNLSCNVQQTRAWFSDLEEGREVMLTALPLFHVFGMTVCLNFAVFTGAAIVLIANPRNIGRIAEAIERHKVTRFPAVPTMYGAINVHPDVEKLDLSSVKSCLSGSAPLPDDTLRRFEELTGGRIVEGFGLTESSPVTHVNPLTGARKVGSIGLPVTGTVARIVDPVTGNEELAAGETGELVISGPQIMAGYWKREEATAETLRDGWLFTGDLATVDDDGYFRIVGRKKDMIVASGYNVYPDEIDRVLCAHPAVLEACTIGIPDEHRGETVKSFVVLTPGVEADVAELRDWCRAELAPYKVPREIEFRDDLPKSAVLKLLRRTLRDEVLAASAKAS